MKFLIAAAAFVPLLQAGEELRPGLVGDYYEIGEEFDDFPALARRKPFKRLIDPDIRFDRTSETFGRTTLKLFFCVRWTGLIRIEKAGKVTFTLASDDGSRLFLDGKLIVNNGGLHGFEEASGEVELTAGTHQVRLDYFQCGGESGCHLYWSREDLAKEFVPAGVLMHKKDADLDR